MPFAEIDLDNVTRRFWPKVQKPEGDGCWTWTAYKDASGYGRINVGGKYGGSQYAHIVSYWLAHRQPVPDGMELDHLCRNRACVNPSHLEAVTHAENIRRGTATEVTVARQRAITHCPSNHLYDADNTRVNGAGARVCRACVRDRARRRRAARQVAMA